jgi:ubiquinone/menaquinone biosynthesis C-methylase UbiE
MRTIDLERLMLGPGRRVLDLGCGTGRHLAAAAEVDGVFAVGIDRHFPDLQEVRRRVNDHRGWGFICGRTAVLFGEATALPFLDKSFDAVICAEVLEHVVNDRAVVAEALRVLTTGGVLAVSVPRRFPEAVMWRLSKSYRNAPGGHVRIYREKALIQTIKSAASHRRLRLIGKHYAHALHTPYWWLKCAFEERRVGMGAVKVYHDFLVREMMTGDRLFQRVERLLNPWMGKSVVLYFQA